MKSPYYPNRAGPLSWFWRFTYPIGRWIERRDWALTRTFPLRRVLLAILIPGYGFYLAGKRSWGRLAMALYVSCALVYIVALGTTVATIAFSLLCSIHATSILFTMSEWLRPQRLWFRLLTMLFTVVVLWQLIYGPLVSLLNATLAVPLRANGARIIAKPIEEAQHLQRGDTVVYEIPAFSVGSLQLRAGFGSDSILGVEGDQIKVVADALLVNGMQVTVSGFLPLDYAATVPEDYLFIWPSSVNVYMQGQGVNPEDVGRQLAQQAMVPKERVLGRAYRSWFGKNLIEE